MLLWRVPEYNGLINNVWILPLKKSTWHTLPPSPLGLRDKTEFIYPGPANPENQTARSHDTNDHLIDSSLWNLNLSTARKPALNLTFFRRSAIFWQDRKLHKRKKGLTKANHGRIFGLSETVQKNSQKNKKTTKQTKIGCLSNMLQPICWHNVNSLSYSSLLPSLFRD